MAKEALEKIKDFSQEEVIQKMRGGEIVPPTDKAERAEFLKFAAMPVSDREGYLSGQDPKPEGGVQPAGTEALQGTTPQEPVPDGSVPSANAAPAEPPVQQGGDEWWKELGYDNTERAREAHKNLLDLSQKQQEAMDRLNAKEGKRGQELKRLKEENDRLQKEIAKFNPSQASEGTKPVKPKKPNIKDFENGAFDDNYLKAVEQYDAELDSYLDRISDYNRAMISKEIEAKVAPARQAAQVEDSWGELFNQRIPEFQKTHGLETTVPVKKISDCFSTLNNPQATAEEKAMASSFSKTIPQTDLDRYARIKAAVEKVYDFSEGMPTPRLKTMSFDDVIQPNTVRPVSLTAEEESLARSRAKAKNEQTASAIPASSLPSGDGKLTDSASGDEKRKRYQTLLRSYNAALNSGKQQSNAFEATESFKELVKLRQELGFKRQFAPLS